MSEALPPDVAAGFQAADDGVVDAVTLGDLPATVPTPTELDGPTGAQRIAAVFDQCRAQRRAALIVYLPAGFPDMATSQACLEAAAAAGADLLEVGFPFSDPMMDGPTIQAANQVALDHGYGVPDDLLMCSLLTAATHVPAVAMTYYTIPDARGLEWFAEGIQAAGLAGAILPDLPANEAAPWLDQARLRGLATIFLASSVSSDARLAAIADVSGGWVYAAGLLGVTGVKAVDDSETRDLVARIRKHTTLPVAVGLGVRTADQAGLVAAYADGVIVGSAAVTAVADGPIESAPQRVAGFVRELRRGIDAAARA